ncbi:MAG: dihydrofolate reductase [Gammaproteobacteria bacterium]|nr:dihydrofolate reductase [Gammaproteobacteria bacterium]
MDISLVVAMDENRLIGAGNGLPWRLPADMKHFKQITMGHPMVMGRRTWESIGRPLPGRTSIVVTGRVDYEAEGAVVVDSPAAAREAAGDCDELMVIGGARLFEQMLGEANRVYLTEIHAAFEGDTWFPELGQDEWACVSREDFNSDERNPQDYSFLVLERVPEALPTPLVQPAL